MVQAYDINIIDFTRLALQNETPAVAYPFSRVLLGTDGEVDKLHVPNIAQELQAIV